MQIPALNSVAQFFRNQSALRLGRTKTAWFASALCQDSHKLKKDKEGDGQDTEGEGAN